MASSCDADTRGGGVAAAVPVVLPKSLRHGVTGGDEPFMESLVETILVMESLAESILVMRKQRERAHTKRARHDGKRAKLYVPRDPGPDGGCITSLLNKGN